VFRCGLRPAIWIVRGDGQSDMLMLAIAATHANQCSSSASQHNHCQGAVIKERHSQLENRVGSILFLTSTLRAQINLEFCNDGLTLVCRDLRQQIGN
jgi:hypothetical protein